MQLGPNQEKWVQALESGDYQQCKGSLRRGDSFCCLGVACDVIAVPEGWEWKPAEREGTYRIKPSDSHVTDAAALPMRVKQMLGLRTCFGDKGAGLEMPDELPRDATLTSLNDCGEYSFARIAKILRTYPDLFFKESK